MIDRLTRERSLKGSDMHAQSCHFHEVRGQAVAVDRGADSGQRSVASRLQGDSTDVTRRAVSYTHLTLPTKLSV